MILNSRFKNLGFPVHANMEISLMSEPQTDQVYIYHVNSDGKKIVLGSGNHPKIVNYLSKEGRIKAWVNIVFKDYIYADIDIMDEDLYLNDAKKNNNKLKLIIFILLLLVSLITLSICFLF